MSRINAGSTLVNQYAPPFVVSDNVATNWRLRWNETFNAFEAFDPNENVVVSGFSSIETATFNNVTQQVFVVPWIPNSALTSAQQRASFIITIEGVKQHQDAYNITPNLGSNTTTITLSDTVSNETVEIIGLQTSGGASIELFGPVPADDDIPNTAQDTFILGWLAPSKQSLIVTIDGVKQAINAYNITPNSTATDTTLTFVETPTMSVSAVGLVSGGTGYSVSDVLTVVGGTFTTAATITVTAEVGGVITGFSVADPGVYTVFPTGTRSTTGAGNNDATFTLTKDSQQIEVVGILTAGETPASPVNVVSAFGVDTSTVFNTFASKTLSGDTQNLNFKSLEAGSNITIVDNTNRLTINSIPRAFDQIGSGTSLFDASDEDANPAVFRQITAGDRLLISVGAPGPADTITVRYNLGYVTSSGPTINVGANERLVGVTPGAAVTINLPAIANFATGDQITIKDQNGTAGTNNITIETDAAELIDGAANYVINSNRGYVTLYSDGTNFHIISEG